MTTRLATFLLACGPCLAFASSATAAPDDSLASDLAAVRKPGNWIVRETVVGWTADDHPIYRSLVCDSDALGGRGPYCELQLCMVDGKIDAATGAQCAHILGDFGLELTNGDDDRAKFKDEDVVKASESVLALLGPLSPGSAAPTASVRAIAKGNSLTLMRRVGKHDEPFLLFHGPKVDGDGHPRSIKRAIVSQVAVSPDKRCTAVIGHRFELAYYEAVSGLVPNAFAKVFCGAK